MKIDIRNIPPEGLRIETREPVKILDIKGEGIGFNEQVDVSILVNRTGNTILINGGLKTSVDLICSRCIKKYRHPLVNNNFNICRDVTSGTEIDISGDIRDEMAILLPIKPLCRAGCKGLCPHCGQDLNEKQCSCSSGKEDIRWLGLDKLELK